MKKLYIQPESTAINIDVDIICTSIPIGNGPINGGEEGFEKAAGKSRYSDWSDYER